MSMEERPRYPKSGKPIRSQPSTGHNNLPRCYESRQAPTGALSKDHLDAQMCQIGKYEHYPLVN